MEEKQGAEVGMNLFERYCTEIAAAARLIMTNKVEEIEIITYMAVVGTDVATIAAGVASIIVVDLFYFESAIWFTRSSYRQ